MLNTFLIRHENGKVQALDDLEIHKEDSPRLYWINKAYPAFSTIHILKIHEVIREVSPGFRTLLQGLDDEIEALKNRREDMLGAAFVDGLQLSLDELNHFLVGDDDGDAID